MTGTVATGRARKEAWDRVPLRSPEGSTTLIVRGSCGGVV